MSFLEKHKERLPGTYARAIVLCDNSGCLKTRNSEVGSNMEHFRNMQDASSALKRLNSGIAQTGG